MTTTVVSAAHSSLTTFAVNGVRADESKIIRRNRMGCFIPRTVSRGSSASTVFTPTRIASTPARSFMPCARAFSVMTVP